MLSSPVLRHRGFELSIRRMSGGDAFGFVVSHLGLDLHASDGAFRSATSADRAARCYVDHALGVYDLPGAALV